MALAIGWIIGEADDKRVLRRVCGPLFAVGIAVVAAGAVFLHTSFDSSIRYSGATKEFVSALVDAIDRGDVEKAHKELRRFDRVANETYEGGFLLKWLTEPVARLEESSSQDPNNSNDEDTAKNGLSQNQK